MKKGYYIANEVNGVWFGGEYNDDTNAVLLTVEEFYNSLTTTSSNITCFFDSDFEEDVEIMNKIKDEYGIIF